MKRQCILKDNKGASLVMVLVAMFFVGVIAAIALTITVGNTKSTKASVDTSENFYSSESVLDDLEMFLRKYATSAATEAYGMTFEGGVDPDFEDDFIANFKDKFVDVLSGTEGVFTSYAESDGNGKMVINADFIKNQICFDRPGTITIKYNADTFANIDSETYPILKGVEIIYVDAEGYETKLTTDITFKAQLPDTESTDTSGEFTYDIDHFVMISGKSIRPVIYVDSDGKSQFSTISGDITGNIYATNNLNVYTETPLTSSDAGDTDWIRLRSQYVLVGGNINVNGRMSVNPVADNTIIYEGAGTKIGAEVWTNNMFLNLKDAEVSTGRQADPDDESSYLNTDVYLKGSLELNGAKSKYTAVGGRLYAYSEDDGTALSGSKPESSAIILNGLGAKLDLSALGSLRVAGKAYTALPDLDGIDALYNYYIGKGSEPDGDISYYAQGESITYRSIQALYLIPGDYITGVGHNPMKASEFAGISKNNIQVPESIFGTEGTAGYKLTNDKIKSHTVRYLNGENYVYLFWDFKSADVAIDYFNEVTKHDSDPDTADGRYYDLILKQFSMMNADNGCIKLPADTKTNGNALKYDTSNKFGKVAATGAGLSGYDGYFNGMMAKLDSSATTSSPNLIENMFEGFYDKDEDGDYTHPAATFFDGPIYGPLSYVDGNGKAHTSSSVEGAAKAKNAKYWLKTGSSVTVNSIDDEYTYIIITPGDVTFASGCTGDFRGIIIAGGNVTLPKYMNMECLGMLKYNSIVGSTSTPVDTTEFKALLSVAIDDSVTTSGNSILRSIFGLRNNSTHVGGDNDGELIKVITDGWSRN